MSPDIFLASASPRRRELLSQIGVRYQLLAADIDETPHPDEVPELYVVRMALEKARAGLARRPAGSGPAVLGADTAVVVDGQILGKPQDQADAARMLRLLSGREHQVMSAVAMVDGEQSHSRLSVSSVTFREVTVAECEAYWATGEPCDKAGGYAVQGLGALFIERLEGSYSGVMGLPLFETGELLRKFAIEPLG